MQAPGYAPATSEALPVDYAAPHVAAGGDMGMLKDGGCPSEIVG